MERAHDNNRTFAESPLGDRVIVPGKRIGSIELGMTYSRICALLGEGTAVAVEPLGFVRYPALDLELVFATSCATFVPANARVIAIDIRGAGEWAGMPRLRAAREDIDERLGEPTLLGGRALYRDGASVHYDAAGKAVALAVHTPFEHELFTMPTAYEVVPPRPSRRPRDGVTTAAGAHGH